MIEREMAKAVAEAREDRFAVVEQMREAFKRVPSEEIERNVIAIIREMRETNQAANEPDEHSAVERRPA